MTPKALPGLQELAEDNGWATSVATRLGEKNDKPIELTVLRLRKGQAQIAACWHNGRWDAAVSKNLKTYNQTELKAVLSAEAPLGAPLEEFEDDVAENIRWERELTGFYLTEHPLVLSQAAREHQGQTTAVVREGRDGQWVSLVGLVLDITGKATRNGGYMARFSIEDSEGRCAAIAFGQIAKDAVDGYLAVLEGPVQVRDEHPELKVTKAELLEEW